MTTIKTIPVSDRAWAVTLPGAVLAFNVDSDPDGRLSEVLSANPGMPAAFFNLTVCDEIFSMAETVYAHSFWPIIPKTARHLPTAGR